MSYGYRGIQEKYIWLYEKIFQGTAKPPVGADAARYIIRLPKQRAMH
jgi:hypothetical protein